MRTVVSTSLGQLRGIEEEGVLAFMGIPFAQPPVGELRWAAPRPAEPWTGERDATEFGPACPQPERPAGVLGGGGSYARKSEDCLYLNVWTPGTDDARRPVMVWIHGGGFTIGYGGDPRYEGRYLAGSGDVVVVTVNYRLGALGFLHLPEVINGMRPATNCGLLDQVRALEWVRDEIRAFGGDPGNVTIFGESAGAMSVATLLGTPPARGLFHKAIAQSGATHGTLTSHEAAATGTAVLDALGLQPSQFAEARARPAEDILAAQLAAAARGGLSFGPTVDGAALPTHPLEAIRDGMSRDIPIISGSNLHEWKLLMPVAERSGISEDTLAARVLARAGTQEKADAVLAGYRATLGAKGEDATPVELWSAIETDRVFRVPNIRLAEAQALHQPQATFMYLFTWRSPQLDGWLGSCHAIDVPFVFGSLHHPILAPFAGSGAEADALSGKVMAAWIAFARTGNPSTPAIGPWPSYRDGARATMVFGRETKVENEPMQTELDLWQAIL